MKLTSTQLEIVVLVANGYRIDEIADKLHRSKSSIDQSLAAARRRMEANTLPHLVSIVIASGILEWQEDNSRAIVYRTQDSNDKHIN